MKIRIRDNTLILTWDKAVDPLVTLRTGMSLVQETSLDEDDNQVITEIKVVYETCDLSFSCSRASLKKGLTESFFLAVQDTILSVSFKGMGFSLSASATDAYGDQVAELCFERDFSKHLAKVNHRCFDEWGDANDILCTARLFITSRPPEAEQNICEALGLLWCGVAQREHIESVDRKLRSTLKDIDPFWVRWGYFIEGHNL